MVKRCAGLAAVCCLLTVALAGCGSVKVPDVIEAPTVSVSNKGQISVWLVGDFGKDYYDLSELTAMAAEEAAEFNASVGNEGREAVTLEKVETLPDNESKVVVSYRFDGWESYTAFNEETLFYGTVGEAIQEGFDTKIVLRNVEDNTLIAGEQFRQASEKHVIITDVKADIYCPGKVTYVSGGAVLNADGSVDTAQAEGTVYILLK